MSRKLMSVLSVLLATIAFQPQAWSTAARCDTLQIVSDTSLPFPYSGDPQNLTAAGNLDWALVGINEKAGGTAIQTLGHGDVGADWQWNTLSGADPLFSYTDGDSAYGDVVNASVKANYRGSFGYANIAVPVGAGTVTVWAEDFYASDTWSASLNDSANATVTASGAISQDMRKIVFSYQADAARTFSWGGGSTIGIYGIAVSTATPEPTTLILIVTGLLSLLAYVWKKR
jgi:hypothetical protein